MKLRTSTVAQYDYRSIGKTVNNLVRARTYQFHVVFMDDKLIDEWLEFQTTKRKSCLNSAYRHFDSKNSLVNYRQNGRYRDDLSLSSNLSTYKFWPLLRVDQKKRRYTKNLQNELIIKQKKRPIMYASHRDSCVMSFYAFLLKRNYESAIKNTPLNNCILGYRRIPVTPQNNKNKSNIYFANDLYNSLHQMEDHVVLCIDIKGFFDNIDHALLKSSLAPFLNDIPMDNLRTIIKNVTKYRYIFAKDAEQLLGTKSWARPELYNKLIRDTNYIHKNKKSYGIPQGTPISDILSNIYLYDFDKSVISKLSSIEGHTLYKRYCDDILIIVPSRNAHAIYCFVSKIIKNYRLEIGTNKTEAFYINSRAKIFRDITREYVSNYKKNKEFIQYLGFYMNLDRIIIRSSTIENHYRKVKKIRGTRHNTKGDINKKHLDTYENDCSKIVTNESIQKQILNVKKHTKKILVNNQKRHQTNTCT